MVLGMFGRCFASRSPAVHVDGAEHTVIVKGATHAPTLRKKKKSACQQRRAQNKAERETAVSVEAGHICGKEEKSRVVRQAGLIADPYPSSGVRETVKLVFGVPMWINHCSKVVHRG
jgi:hypothetical protein